MRQGNVQGAKAKFRMAIALTGESGSGSAAIGYLVQLHNEGMAHLADATKLYDNRQYLEAFDLAEQTRTRYANLFGGLRIAKKYPNVSRKAVDLIAEWKNDPLAAEAFQERAAAAHYDRIQRLQAKAEADSSKYYDLYRALKSFVRRYPNCPTGRDAAGELRRLEQDPELSELITREQQRRFILAALRRIEENERDGLLDKVEADRAELQKKFPGKTLDDLRRMTAKRA